MKRLLTLLVMAALTLAAYPAMASVSGTPHDFTGSGGFGLCQVCHVPHAASSVTKARLWRVDITMQTLNSTWDGSVVGNLCGETCHESGAAIFSKNAAGQQPHQVASIFAATSHGRSWSTLKTARTSGGIGDTPADTGRPYYSQPLMECTSCHNPHDESVRPFLRTVPGENTISKVCGGCHDRYSNAVGAGNVGPLNSATLAATGRTPSVSMHPVDKPFFDDPANDSNGGVTQFHEPSPSVVTAFIGTGMRNSVDPNFWVLGGKFQDSNGKPITTSGYTVSGAANAGAADQVGCQTCHSIHAPAATTDGSQGLYLLAIDNQPSASTAGAPLCEDCHGGGYNGDPTRSGSNNQYVGGTGSALTADNQTYRDHPIDQATDGTPKLEAWNSTTRYERLPTGAPVVWPFVSGAYVPSNNSNLGGGIGRIICTSCHSAHNALTATSINRSGGNATFCFSCHLSTDMVPGNHHSTTFDKAQPSGLRGGNWDSSAIQCSGCHASVGTPTAHMGFFNLNLSQFSATTNADSELCNGCHQGGTADPVDAAIAFPSTIPNGHLSASPNGGTERSHYLGTIKGTTGNSINVKTGYWLQTVNNGRPGSSYSKYGGSGTDTHNNVAPTVTVGTSTMVCESCHSVLYNCGDGSITGGYAVNLLLQNYEDNKNGATDGSILGTSVLADDGKGNAATLPYTYTVGGSGVGSGLCVACHNQGVNANGMGTSNGFVAHSVVNGPAGSGITPANMHPMTGWTITRAVDAGRTPTTLITGAGSYADQVAPAAAPNAGSYDGTNAMSCDGCHRPHRADKFGAWKPGYQAASVSVILESAGPVNGDYGTLCEQCHNM